MNDIIVIANNIEKRVCQVVSLEMTRGILSRRNHRLGSPTWRVWRVFALRLGSVAAITWSRWHRETAPNAWVSRTDCSRAGSGRRAADGRTAAWTVANGRGMGAVQFQSGRFRLRPIHTLAANRAPCGTLACLFIDRPACGHGTRSASHLLLPGPPAPPSAWPSPCPAAPSVEHLFRGVLEARVDSGRDDRCLGRSILKYGCIAVAPT